MEENMETININGTEYVKAENVHSLKSFGD